MFDKKVFGCIIGSVWCQMLAAANQLSRLPPSKLFQIVQAVSFLHFWFHTVLKSSYEGPKLQRISIKTRHLSAWQRLKTLCLSQQFCYFICLCNKRQRSPLPWEGVAWALGFTFAWCACILTDACCLEAGLVSIWLAGSAFDFWMNSVAWLLSFK